MCVNACIYVYYHMHIYIFTEATKARIAAMQAKMSNGTSTPTSVPKTTPGLVDICFFWG